ncbi:MAG: glycosyl transferase, partial [Ignavibacteriae bacterium]|nr:glycosyl transferase [Ignavibacteriota bacterium]
FIDQDIISTKNYLKTFVDHAEINKFIVSYPIRLTKEQTKDVDGNMIENFSYGSILKTKQLYKIKKQFVKDYVSFLQKKFKINKKGPKLRSGVFAIHRDNFIKVNGFDEKYQGWGNEDDDLGNRLYAANIVGYNPFWSEYPIHLYHEPNHQAGNRVNKTYYENQKKMITNSNCKCEYGFDNPLGDEQIKVIELN